MDFIQKQIEFSERLFKLMEEDHKKRIDEIVHWSSVMSSLVSKLDERDQIISDLRNKIKDLQSDNNQKDS